MPIYAYRCEGCGFAKDVLQKMSEDPLTVCPECQQPSFKKQVTAAGFQLKGSGWYVTDFRGGNAGGAGANTGAATGVTANNEGKSGSATATEAKDSSAGAGVSSGTGTSSDSSSSTNSSTNANASSTSENKAA
ncbi:FmdB family zinc ribbon protein [Undibacterium flavidum]|uniref:Zinc ribbon domain-containing protein n=1 Tax=Undibacterium flavidum TaxID=2762297 RepID=A0ABR6Y743_9BURK|nr:FmdB family zinc ribbon protein [Undibacterium flavidum]MBC3872432.1 zinc ribbon domain-containing protein [Undibacterium flavidum]